MSSVQEEIRQFVTNELLRGNGRDLQLDTPLFELRILDSITVVELYTFVENRYGVRLDDAHVSPDDFGTIRLLARLIEARTQPQA